MGRVPIVVDGQPMSAPEGSTVAAALVDGGVARFRRSVSGQPRGPLCAMGICHECRVTIDGIAHRRACMIEVAPGMRIDTDA
jgi:sarcosine oxidase subunit alpha